MDNKELCKLRLNEAMRDIDITAQELADRSGINKLLIWRSVVYLQMLANTGFLEFECSKNQDIVTLAPVVDTVVDLMKKLATNVMWKR